MLDDDIPFGGDDLSVGRIFNDIAVQFDRLAGPAIFLSITRKNNPKKENDYE